MKSLAIGASVLALASAAHAAEMGAVDEPIKLAINEWTGQHVSTHVAGSMLEAAGYKVEYVTAGYMNMYQAMADGELHAALEIWSSNVSDQYGQLKDAGKVEELSDLGLEAREGFAYPAHVAEICPGLPAWESHVWSAARCMKSVLMHSTSPSARSSPIAADCYITTGRSVILTRSNSL